MVEVLRFLVAPLIAAVIAAVLTTYLGAHFSFQRFRKEQWWHEKRSAYDSIITQLSRIKFDADRELVNLDTGGDLMPPKRPEWEKSVSWSLQEVASAGAYIVSEKTVEAASKMISALSMVGLDGDYHGELSRVSSAAGEALRVVRGEAHRDLGVSGQSRLAWFRRLWKS